MARSQEGATPFFPVQDMTQSLQHSLPSALQNILENQAPQATLLATIGEQILQFRAGKAVYTVKELSPPDKWFESGQLEWLTHDGALLGLIWSPAGLSSATLQLLTLLLSAARPDEGQRATQVLMTQFPESAAWLDEELKFLQVSRRFLELYSLGTEQVIGRSFAQVFPERQELHALLEEALAGKAVTYAQEALPWPTQAAQVLWLRSQIRPYFGGEGAGVLWTMQDISAEVSQAARVSALLDSARVPTAILNRSGILLDYSDSLAQVLAEWHLEPPPRGQAISEWPIWDSAASTRSTLTQLLKQAGAEGHSARTLGLNMAASRLPSKGGRVELALHQGKAERLMPHLDNLLVAEFHFADSEASLPSQLLGLLVGKSPQAMLLLGPPDAGGERPLWLMSEVARGLLGLERGVPKAGESFGELLRQQQVSFSRTDASPLSTAQVIAQSQKQGAAGLPLIITRPDGSRRHLEVTSIALSAGEPTQPAPLSVYLEDVTSKRHLEERLQHEARHDPLTGLPNWAGLRDRLNAPKNQGHCLLVLSIDDYTTLQAALGRSPCDHLLIQMAARLHQWRKEARVARLEGEHFVVALALGVADTAPKLARELQEILAKPMRAGGREVQLSVSVGISSGKLSADDLLDQGRSALYAAQRTGTGRGGIEVYDARLRQHEAELVGLEAELRQALQRPSGQMPFTVLLQPVVGLHSGRVQGAELLLRWNHPERGLISPRVFLPLVSHAGLMTSLGEWVLQQAAALRERWAEQYPFLKLHLNLSREELHSPDYLEGFRATLQQVGNLNLEISAESLLQGEGRHGEGLRELRQLGCEIFVDDFGDGASSLTSLERFALSGVKLHPAFVGNLQEGPRPLALLEGTVSLARRLNLQVIAVGVETQAQAQLLSNAGCDAAQGYFYSPPKALEEFEYWLTSQVMD